MRYLRTIIVIADIDEGFGRSAAKRLHTLIYTDFKLICADKLSAIISGGTNVPYQR